MGVFKMAWRNVWRNRRRTIVTVAAMSLALFAMIQYSGLIEGYLVGMERNILDLEMGDIQIFAKGYGDNPSLYAKIDESQALLDKLEKAQSMGIREFINKPLSPRELAESVRRVLDQSIEE